MNYVLVFIMLFFVLFFFIMYYLIRLVLGIQRRKNEVRRKDSTQVGFVVDTFHDLVTKLKDKERELEVLKKNAEERASSVELYSENILQSVPSGVISLDDTLKVTKLNAAAQKILDLNESEVIGKSYLSVFAAPVSDIIKTRQTLERAEIGYVTHTGKRIWLGLNISPLKDSTDNTMGRIMVFTDLTELKAFQSQMELRERLSSLGEMSAGIAHELRNPMAVISGYTKILLKKVDPTLVHAVDAIAREVSVMDRIISDFLSFARPNELVRSDVDLKELILSCIDALGDRLADIRVSTDISMLPVVRADEVLLRQSVINLLQNALEAMPEGGELIIAGSMDNTVDFSITDTGHGIPENLKDKIFLPFYSTKERGTGLGLSIVHKVVISHGGVIDVSRSEKGTTFCVRLPREIIV